MRRLGDSDLARHKRALLLEELIARQGVELPTARRLAALLVEPAVRRAVANVLHPGQV